MAIAAQGIAKPDAIGIGVVGALLLLLGWWWDSEWMAWLGVVIGTVAGAGFFTYRKRVALIRNAVESGVWVEALLSDSTISTNQCWEIVERVPGAGCRLRRIWWTNYYSAYFPHARDVAVYVCDLGLDGLVIRHDENLLLVTVMAHRTIDEKH